MHARAAALPLATARIAEPHLPKPRRPGLDVTGFWIVEQFKLEAPQRVFERERCYPLRKDARLDEGEELRHLSHLGVYYSVVLSRIARGSRSEGTIERDEQRASRRSDWRKDE